MPPRAVPPVLMDPRKGGNRNGNLGAPAHRSEQAAEAGLGDKGKEWGPSGLMRGWMGAGQGLAAVAANRAGWVDGGKLAVGAVSRATDIARVCG